MTDLDYRICKIIKYFNDIHKADPTINDIAKVIDYSIQGTRYHLNKLVKIKIIKKENSKYYLLVNNLE